MTWQCERCPNPSFLLSQRVPVLIVVRSVTPDQRPEDKYTKVNQSAMAGKSPPKVSGTCLGSTCLPSSGSLSPVDDLVPGKPSSPTKASLGSIRGDATQEHKPLPLDANQHIFILSKQPLTWPPREAEFSQINSSIELSVLPLLFMTLIPVKVLLTQLFHCW